MSDIELKPCPNCGSNAEMWIEDACVYAVCMECDMHGPAYLVKIANTEKTAAEAWNSLPRHLRWTTETPTEPGWYWQRRDKEDTPLPVRVENVGDCPTAAQWAGPIHEPLEQP